MEEALLHKDQSPGRKNIIRDVCLFILVMELAERICFFTFAGSITYFLRDHLNYSQATASAMNSVFNSLVYVTPLLGGYIADTHWGRYRTIAFFGGVYLLGTVLMAVAAIPSHLTPWLFMFSFFCLAAVGAGGLKSNVITMGGDQFNEHDPEEVKQKEKYFVYFYWIVNIGTLVSYFVLTQIATNPTAFQLPGNSGFFVTFLLSASALCIALSSFFYASNRYILKPPEGSALTSYTTAISAATNHSSLAQGMVTGVGLLVCGVACGIAQPFLPWVDTILSYIACAMVFTGILTILFCTTGSIEWLDAYPMARQATKVLPVLLNTVSFQVVYGAMAYFPLSACQMDLLVFGKFQINASMLASADSVAIITVIPLLDGYIYPLVTKLIGRKITVTDKYVSGIVVSLIAILSAALLEMARRRASDVPACSNDDHRKQECESLCAADDIDMSNFPVWWMAIPFFLIGVGECLCNIPLYDLCYSHTPARYRSMANAVFLFVFGVGSMLTGAFTTALTPYLPDNLNHGHLEYFYFVCMGFVVIFLPINVYFFSSFEASVKNETEAQEEGQVPADSPEPTEDALIHARARCPSV